jgi:hypothetical protein
MRKKKGSCSGADTGFLNIEARKYQYPGSGYDTNANGERFCSQKGFYAFL